MGLGDERMMLQLELWHLITLLLAFFGCVGAFGQVLLKQFEKRQAVSFQAQDDAREAAEKRQDERFAAQEAARRAAQDHWDQRFSTLDESAKQWARVERDFLVFKAELPMTFVMRDDYVRNQTVIEAKLDGLALRLENAQLKGKI